MYLLVHQVIIYGQVYFISSISFSVLIVTRFTITVTFTVSFLMLYCHCHFLCLCVISTAKENCSLCHSDSVVALLVTVTITGHCLVTSAFFKCYTVTVTFTAYV